MSVRLHSDRRSWSSVVRSFSVSVPVCVHDTKAT